MYGSSRLGIWSRNVNMDVLPTGGGTVRLLGTLGIDTFNRGNKFFELANHLGNVLVTVSDRKFGQSPVNNLYTSFTADVVSATDYAPFGMQMVGRSFDAAGSMAYRYGFNGQEKSPEVSSNSFTAEYWQYDTRIGRRWNIDPVPKTSVSGYIVLGNNPVSYIDPNGADWYKNNSTGNVEYKSKWHRKNHHGYEYLGKDKGAVFTHEGTEYNRKEGTATTSLDPIVITAFKKKPSIASRTSWGQVFNQITPSLAQETRNEIANYTHSRDAGMQANRSLYSNGINLERHYIGEKQGRNLTLGFAGAVVLPLATFAAVESGAAYYLYVKYGTTFLSELSKNALSKRGKFEKIDWNDVVINTLTKELSLGTRIVARSWNSMSDFNYEMGFQSVFTGNKKGLDVGLDAFSNTFKLAFGELNPTSFEKEFFGTILDQIIAEYKEINKNQ
jgi:RHS repeat-associated protein